jgi:hypothetical protein
VPSEPPIPKPVVDKPEVRALCAGLVPGEIPKLVKVDAPPWAEPQECVGNVESVIEIHGGTVQYGWQLWETWPGVLIEAEFHAVWIDDHGRSHDVTPKELPGIKQIVFLPDPKLVYEGRQIDNVRMPLKGDPLISEFIEAAEAFYEVTNRGELADYHGDLVLMPEMRAIQERRMGLEMKILEKYYALPS